MSKNKFILVFSCLSLLIGCSQEQKINNITYNYSMESIGNFKIELKLNPDTSYVIHRSNQYFDKFDGNYRSIEKHGKLSKNEYDKFRALIHSSKIHKMKDSYGFSDEMKTDNSIIYYLELIQNKQHKFVTINSKAEDKFSDSFVKLIEYTNDFINKEINSN